MAPRKASRKSSRKASRKSSKKACKCYKLKLNDKEYNTCKKNMKIIKTTERWITVDDAKKLIKKLKQ